MTLKIRSTMAPLAVAIVALASGAHAGTNLVLNGGFEMGPAVSTQFGADFGGQVVPSWTGLGGNHLQFYYVGGTQTTVSPANQFGDTQADFHTSMNTLSPQGGNFIGLDGDSSFDGSLSQTISGLVAGKTYDLQFYWGAAQLLNRTGATTEQLSVSLGGDNQLTGVLDNVSEGFTGWQTVNMHFTATGTSEVLNFLSLGTPAGLPPIAVLDGVSLTAVPEPAMWGLMLVGFGGLGAALRRRRALIAA
jgi:Protein of unknown function (DUF642)/PEP-CTERM motif